MPRLEPILPNTWVMLMVVIASPQGETMAYGMSVPSWTMAVSWSVTGLLIAGGLPVLVAAAMGPRPLGSRVRLALRVHLAAASAVALAHLALSMGSWGEGALLEPAADIAGVPVVVTLCVLGTSDRALRYVQARIGSRSGAEEAG